MRSVSYNYISILMSLLFLTISFQAGAQIRKNVKLQQPFPLSVDAGNDQQIAYGGSTLIGGFPAAVHGNTGYIYLWQPATGLNNPALSNPAASPLSTTKYKLTVTDGKGCSAIDSVTVTVGADMIDELLSQSIGISYDPAKNAVVIENNRALAVDLSIIDLLGRLKFSYKINGSGQIGCDGFSEGVYLVKIGYRGSFMVKKLLVN